MAAETERGPIIIPPLPLGTRVGVAIRLWAFKILVSLALRVLPWLKPAKFRKIAPTYSKRYPIRPTLQSRIFLPKNYSSGQRLPLYINIHGGGFAIGDPIIDDHFCRYFADTFGYCVASIDYRKAPLYPFPVGVYDCAELARAVLADKDLPFDRDRVVVGGFSAGGNLSLAIAQFEDLKSQIKGVIPFYPATDFSRKFRGEFLTTKDGREDILKNSTRLFNWAYVPVGVDRRNTLLSVVYATRKDLPQKMYFIGAEYDCLCQEANVLAKRLAGIDSEPDRGPLWNANGIQWELVPDQQHGFTHVERKGDEEVERLKVCHELYARVNAWIRREVFQ